MGVRYRSAKTAEEMKRVAMGVLFIVLLQIYDTDIGERKTAAEKEDIRWAT